MTKNPWLDSATANRGADYDAAFDRLASSGADVHGEASFVERLGVRTVLDAGCGTGRVAVELARRGMDVAGVDLDPAMLEAARRKAPTLPWLLDDLATVSVAGADGRRRAFEAVVLAGNVMIFLTPGTEARVVANLAAHLVAGGALVAGFQLGKTLTVENYDAMCGAAGLALEERFSTWDRDPWTGGAEFQVSVHRRKRGHS